MKRRITGVINSNFWPWLIMYLSMFALVAGLHKLADVLE